MSLMQANTAVYFDRGVWRSRGLTELVYGCDGCEAKTGDPFARLARVMRSPGGAWDDSELAGWVISDDDKAGSRCWCYCPDCALEETSGV